MIEIGDVVEDITTNQKYTIVGIHLSSYLSKTKWDVLIKLYRLLEMNIQNEDLLWLFLFCNLGEVFVTKEANNGLITKIGQLPFAEDNRNIKVHKATKESKFVITKNMIVNESFRDLKTFTEYASNFIQGFDIETFKIFLRDLECLQNEISFTKIKRLKLYHLYSSSDSYYVYVGKGEYVEMCAKHNDISVLVILHTILFNLNNGRREKIDKNILLDTGVDCKFVNWLRNEI